MLKSPPFSKSSLNFAQFDGKFIGICKNLPSVLTTEDFTFLPLTISCVLLPVPVESRNMSKISIELKFEGIYSRKPVHNGDEKVGHIYPLFPC